MYDAVENYLDSNDITVTRHSHSDDCYSTNICSSSEPKFVLYKAYGIVMGVDINYYGIYCMYCDTQMTCSKCGTTGTFNPTSATWTGPICATQTGSNNRTDYRMYRMHRHGTRFLKPVPLQRERAAGLWKINYNVQKFLGIFEHRIYVE